MPALPISRLVPGMQTAQEVRDRSGRLLVGAGRPLTAQNIQVLQAWGVVAVEIAGIPDSHGVDPGAPAEVTLENADPARLQAARARIDDLFRHVDLCHPVAAELARILTLRLLRQPAGETRP